jgi:signal transduction histidine kinase
MTSSKSYIDSLVAKYLSGRANKSFIEYLFMWVSAIMALVIQPILQTYAISIPLSFFLSGLSIISWLCIYFYKKAPKISFYTVLIGFGSILVIARFLYSSEIGSSPVNSMAELFFCIVVIFRFGIKRTWWVPFSFIVLSYVKLHLFGLDLIPFATNDSLAASRLLLFFFFVGSFLYAFTSVFSIQLTTLISRLRKTTARYKDTILALEKENAELNKAYAAISEISSRNSHEMRRPVARVQALLQMYEDMGQDEALVNEMMNISLPTEIEKALNELQNQLQEFEQSILIKN